VTPLKLHAQAVRRTPHRGPGGGGAGHGHGQKIWSRLITFLFFPTFFSRELDVLGIVLSKLQGNISIGGHFGTKLKPLQTLENNSERQYFLKSNLKL